MEAEYFQDIKIQTVLMNRSGCRNGPICLKPQMRWMRDWIAEAVRHAWSPFNPLL